MTTVVAPDKIEGLVGARRHATRHLGRAVSTEHTVYVLHSEACRSSTPDLRECEFSLALDAGMGVGWIANEDSTVAVKIDGQGRLAVVERPWDDDELNDVRLLLTKPNPPLPVAEVLACADTANGVPVVWIGEDGDAIVPTGTDPIPFDAVLKALAALTDGDYSDTDNLSHQWYVATRHEPDCHEGLELGDRCGCEEQWSFWGSFAAEGTPGAFPVIQWRA